MLYIESIDVYKGIDVNKSSEWKVCDICQYWYFLLKGLKFQLNICYGCHDLLIMSMNLSYIAILNITCSNHCCIMSGLSKNEATKLMQIASLTEKSRTL